MKRVLHKLGMTVAAGALMLGMVACSSNGSTKAPEGGQDGAANYPAKEVKLIVPAAAGGTLDLAPRAMAQAFQELTGQALVVENHPGGGQVPGTMLMVDAEPDGYTLAMLPSGLLSLRPALQQVDFTFPDDFTPIIGVGDFQIIYAAPADAPYDTMAEMATYYAAQGGEPRFGSAGVNTYGHVLAVMAAKQTGMSIRHLPFDGNPAAVTAILGGNAEVAVVNLSNVEAQLDAGTVKVLGVPAQERYSNYEEAPTLKEQGIDVVGGATFALYGPAGMPVELQEQLREWFAEAMESEQFQTFVTNTNLLVTGETPDELVQAIVDDKQNIDAIKAELGG
ncbi:tripartite tricarboxylate transporter substrate binding protein [Paenibacillus sp. IB182496]|uniref:Tripartite tricarboxylate transporter substrate binding protein n=1 Tax=Paenibacillus sabuli TaxID=2772509 RepID=A0A927BXD4_9BACL|nr:tripartite tricarboxylate transporter substrate binding protein [Paenibacillus sabuli]MBD2847088.1 tripartite tricarboxylate transporter substrate binding protein [Paenibacillus sabuli]